MATGTRRNGSCLGVIDGSASRCILHHQNGLPFLQIHLLLRMLPQCCLARACLKLWAEAHPPDSLSRSCCFVSG